MGTWAEGSGFVVAILVARLAPHSAQNLALSEPTAPQVGHVRGKAEPHSAQNLAAAATGALQLGHSTFAPSIYGLCTLTQSYWCEERRSEPDSPKRFRFRQAKQVTQTQIDGRNWHFAGVPACPH